MQADDFTSRNLCKPCLTEYRRADHRRRAAKMRAAVLWKKFRITPEDYDALRQAQDYRCAVCLRHEDEIDTRLGRNRLDGQPKFSGGVLVVDHCHESNIVRKLLCSPCNSGIGYLQDSPAIVERALQYLVEHQHLLAEPRRERPMPIGHVEGEVKPMCRNGLHEKMKPGRCQPCAAASIARAATRATTSRSAA